MFYTIMVYYNHILNTITYISQIVTKCHECFTNTSFIIKESSTFKHGQLIIGCQKLVQICSTWSNKLSVTIDCQL